MTGLDDVTQVALTVRVLVLTLRQGLAHKKKKRDYLNIYYI